MQIPPDSTNPAVCAELLGELRLLRDGRAVELPASRKTRALLGYLLSSDTRRTRSELCDLLWEEAADPRAALRWSLSKLRHALGVGVLQADRNSVGLQHGLCAIDSLIVTNAATLLPETSSGELIDLESRFRGEFLNGLEMPGCYRFYEWCQAERAHLGNLHETILTTLCVQLASEPERALVYHHKLAAINPLDETQHVRIVALLMSLGRSTEAMTQANQCRNILSSELGIEPSDLLAAALEPVGGIALVTHRSGSSNARPSKATRRGPSVATELLGRESELRQIETALSDTAEDVVMIIGAPGIGKSALLNGVRQSFMGRVLSACAIESEQSRAFGIWIDALRTCDVQHLSDSVASGLQSLVSAGPGAEHFAREEQIYEVVAGALLDLNSTEPLLVLIDDLQWIDAASVALLNYAIRRCAGRKIRFCLAARPGELEDNDRARVMLTGIAGRTRRISLTGLADDPAAALLKSVNPHREPLAVLSQAKGNPLYLISLAGSEQETGVQERSGSLSDILVSRIDGLPQSSISLLSWAAVSGPQVPIEMLVEAAGISLDDAMDAMDRLIRHEMLMKDDQEGCSFAHDLFRDAAYSRLSNTRRRLMHGKIARLLSLDMNATPNRPLDVLRHSTQSGQLLLGATAAIQAGENALRLYANTEAAHLARQGLALADRLTSRSERASVAMKLRGLQVFAASDPEKPCVADTVATIQQEIEDASHLAMASEVAHGYYVISVLHQKSGDYAASQAATELAADAANRIEIRLRVRQLANSARCLFELGREIPKARSLTAEAVKLATGYALTDIEVIWSMALRAHWDGDLTVAASLIDDAIRVARANRDRWRESKCLTWAAMIALEDDRHRDALAFAIDLGAIAAKLGEGSCAALAASFAALAQKDDPAFRAAIEGLQQADDKSHQSTMLNLAAGWQTRAGENHYARRLAVDAFAIAKEIGSMNEMVCAAAQIRLNTDSCKKVDPRYTRLFDGSDKNQLSARTLNLVDQASGNMQEP